MLNLASQGVSLGFSAGAMPGPFQSYLISSALAYGWRKSMVIIVSPLITDGPVVVLTVFILGQIPDQFIQLVQLVGGLYLLWMAFRAGQRLRRGITFDVSGAPPASRTLTQGLLMNWLSPGLYLFWGTINGPLLLKALQQSPWHGLAFLLAFYGTFLGFLALYVLVFDRLRRLDERITRAIFALTIGVLVLFGLSLLWQGVSTL